MSGDSSSLFRAGSVTNSVHFIVRLLKGDVIAVPVGGAAFLDGLSCFFGRRIYICHLAAFTEGRGDLSINLPHADLI
jgi:hypothetical protein